MKINPIFLQFLQAILLLLELPLLAPNSWRAIGAKVGCIEKERQALLHIKASLVDKYGLLYSWGSEEVKSDCCEWKGVHCSNQTGHVEMLDLHGDDDAWLKGNISSSMMELDHLMYLNLSWNHFEGNNIPEFFGLLSNLRYLDLKDCSFGGNIPIHLGRLPQLRFLDLSWNNLRGSIPYQLGNLSQLQYLGLGFNDALKVDQEDGSGGEWLSSLTSLTYLDLSEVINLNHSHNWLQLFGKLPKLKELRLRRCGLSDHFILSLPPSKLNFSTSLAVLYLSSNSFTSSIIFHWLMNVSSNLVELDLSFNLLEGLIPYEFGNTMNSIEQLNLSRNKLKGGIMKSFKNMCTLRSLRLYNCHLSEELSTILENLSGCATYSLQELYLGRNQITGTLPDLSMLTSLKTLYLSDNKLNGKVPEDIRFPSQLVSLSLRNNSLKGVITNSHFANMSMLKMLDLSFNSLTFSDNLVPSFQLNKIYLKSCKLGPKFPKWLQTQNNFTWLNMYDAGISDVVPIWFWDLSPNIYSIDLSKNNLKGTIPNLPIRFTKTKPVISLDSNQFEGPIPPFLLNVSILNLAKNKFSKSLTLLCTIGEVDRLGILDLSSNQLSGQLPDCWSHFKSLVYLDLSNNNLSGKVPPSIGYLHELQELKLRNNSFIGELPFSLKSCSKLRKLDVGENRLSGLIPPWIGNGLLQLQMLSLRMNLFSGSLPMHLCYLTSIQLLDLSFNNISRQIPKCFNNFTAMKRESVSTDSFSHSYPSNGTDGRTIYSTFGLDALLMWKGVEQLFVNHQVKLLKSIDLSSNQLSGEIPVEIGDLVQLISLNLSRNILIGKIPSHIGQLTSLEFLDLSRNHLIGSIPSSLAQIDRLTMLDLSHNNFSGKIPIGTQLQSFNGSCYEDNLDLCGEPLGKNCSQEETPQPEVDFQEDGDIFSKSFYWSMSMGFITGFCGIFGSILFNRSWRHAYFRFLNNLTDTVYVIIAINLAKCHRLLKQ